MKYMIIPMYSSVYYAPLIPKREYNVERQLTYDLYYQCDSEVKLMKDTRLEVFFYYYIVLSLPFRVPL
jgi:hypothetical protein